MMHKTRFYARVYTKTTLLAHAWSEYAMKPSLLDHLHAPRRGCYHPSSKDDSCICALHSNQHQVSVMPVIVVAMVCILVTPKHSMEDVIQHVDAHMPAHCTSPCSA